MARKLRVVSIFAALGFASLLLLGGFLLATPVSAHPELVKSDPAADALLGALFPTPKGIRLLGVTLSSLAGQHEPEPDRQQLTLPI